MFSGSFEELQPYSQLLEEVAQVLDLCVRKASAVQEEGFEKTAEYKDARGRYRPTQIDLYKSFLPPLLDVPEFANKGITFKKRGVSHIVTLAGLVRLPVRTVPKGKDLNDLNLRRNQQEELAYESTLFALTKREYVLCVALHEDRLQDGAKAIGVTFLDENGQPSWEDVVLLNHQIPQEVVKDEDDFAEFVKKMKISEPEAAEEGNGEENGGESTSNTA